MSPQAQNDILKLLVLKILRRVAKDIADSGCYSILASESTDASNTQQLVICIRWVTKDLEVFEEFIGMLVQQANAVTIVSSIRRSVEARAFI